MKAVIQKEVWFHFVKPCPGLQPACAYYSGSIKQARWQPIPIKDCH
jgi:hypothetical protein